MGEHDHPEAWARLFAKQEAEIKRLRAYKHRAKKSYRQLQAAYERVSRAYQAVFSHKMELLKKDASSLFETTAGE